MADQFAVGMLRLMPVIGNELPTLLDSAWADNPYMQEAFRKEPHKFGLLGPATLWGLNNVAGIAKAYPINPEDGLSGRAKGIERERRKRQEELLSAPKVPYTPPYDD